VITSFTRQKQGIEGLDYAITYEGRDAYVFYSSLDQSLNIQNVICVHLFIRFYAIKLHRLEKIIIRN